MKEYQQVLNENEQILWEGKPVFWPFFLGNSLFLTLFGLFWMGSMSAFVVNYFFISSFIDSGPSPFFIFLMPHFWIGLLMLFGPTIYNVLVYKHMYYVITDKRVIFQRGLIGRDFTMVDFDQITNADVSVGIVDKLLNKNSGSIHIATGGTFVTTKHGIRSNPYVLSHISNPYEVFKFLKMVSHDVKTDIQYPNKFRPAENPGYQTSYTPEK